MKSFFNVQDLGNLDTALTEALEVKKNRFGYQELGKNKTLLMIFFNNSLRTRLSTQKAAMNLGMNVIVLDVNAGAWKLETERGVIMDGDKSEHLLEAIPVMGSYCDLIGVRSFAGLSDREYDYAETIVNQFVKYSGRPVFAMETATVHPLQAFADLITIHEKWEELKSNPATAPTKKRPKVDIAVTPAAAVGMAGNERQKITPRLDQNLFGLIWADDPDLRNTVGHRFPKVGQYNFVSDLQKLDVPEKQSSVPAPMPCQDAVRVFPADGHGADGKLRDAVVQMRFCRTEENWLLQIHLWDGKNADRFVFQTVLRQIKNRRGICPGIGQTLLPVPEDFFVVCLHSGIQIRICHIFRVCLACACRRGFSGGWLVL